MLRRLVPLVVVGAALAACGGSDGDASSAGEAPADESTEASDSDEGRCDLLTIAEVEEAVGFAVESSEPTDGLGGPGCSYEFTDENIDLDIRISDAEFAYQNVADSSSAETVTDLGVRAVTTGQSRRIAVDLGDGMTLVLGIDGAIGPIEDARAPLTELATIAIERI